MTENRCLSTTEASESMISLKFHSLRRQNPWFSQGHEASELRKYDFPKVFQILVSQGQNIIPRGWREARASGLRSHIYIYIYTYIHICTYIYVCIMYMAVALVLPCAEHTLSAYINIYIHTYVYIYMNRNFCSSWKQTIEIQNTCSNEIKWIQGLLRSPRGQAHWGREKVCIYYVLC